MPGELRLASSRTNRSSTRPLSASGIPGPWSATLTEAPRPSTGGVNVRETLPPLAPAVANALYRFDGKRRTRLPMKDSPAAKAMSVGK